VYVKDKKPLPFKPTRLSVIKQHHLVLACFIKRKYELDYHVVRFLTLRRRRRRHLRDAWELNKLIEEAEDDPLFGIKKPELDSQEGSYWWGVWFPPTYLCDLQGKTVRFSEPFTEYFLKYFHWSDKLSDYSPQFTEDLSLFLREYYVVQEYNLHAGVYDIPRDLAIRRDELLKTMERFCAGENNKLIWPPQKERAPRLKTEKKELRIPRKGNKSSVRGRHKRR